MNTCVLLDGHAYDKEELEKALTEMDPESYPDRWDSYFRAWRALDRRKESRK